MTRIGMFGLGNMGRPMAENLAAAERFEVTVWARDPVQAERARAAGCDVAPSPREVALVADIILTVLPDLAELDEILNGPQGILAGVTRETVLVVSSTSSPAQVRELGATLARLTDDLLHLVDAPLSGGADGAEAATLSIMVGGETTDVRRVTPMLEVLGTVAHLGALGSGQVAKACNQMIVAASILALGEASVIAERAGIDLETLFGVLSKGYAGSRVLESRSRRFIEKDYTVSGPAKFMVKDLGFATDEARAGGTSTALLGTLLDAFEDLTARGFGDLDISVTQAYTAERSR